MKLNKENYELVMFDMLEGNLPELETLQAMKQIEEDEFYFKEWNLFKSTVLVPEPNYTYTKKDSLLKKETKVVPMGWWLATAAACLVAAFIFLLPSYQVTQPVADSKTEPVIEKVIPMVTEEAIKEVASAKKDVILPAIKQENDKLNKAPEAEILPVIIDKSQTLVKEEIAPLIISEKKELQQLPKTDLRKQDIANNLESIVPVIEKNNKIETPNVVLKQQEIPLIKKMETFVTSNPKERIIEKGNEIIALFSHPKIRIKPQFDGRKPGLQIELETQGYQAIASVQPFKNNRN